MNISDKLNLILTEYSSGNKESAYKKFKKIYLKNNKDIKLLGPEPMLLEITDKET